MVYLFVLQMATIVYSMQPCQFLGIIGGAKGF